MSYTEIYSFGKDGKAKLLGEVRNAFRGAMAVWSILEDRYLPPYNPGYPVSGYTPKRTSAIFDDNAMKEIWALHKNPKVCMTDKIVLCSTFDNVTVNRANVPDLLKAYRTFEGDTNLLEQADLIEQALADDSEIIAIAFNQTSVNGDTWTNKLGYDEETEESIPYNILEGKDHWSLFKDLEQANQIA